MPPISEQGLCLCKVPLIHEDSFEFEHRQIVLPHLLIVTKALSKHKKLHTDLEWEL